MRKIGVKAYLFKDSIVVLDKNYVVGAKDEDFKEMPYSFQTSSLKKYMKTSIEQKIWMKQM